MSCPAIYNKNNKYFPSIHTCTYIHINKINNESDLLQIEFIRASHLYYFDYFFSKIDGKVTIFPFSTIVVDGKIQFFFWLIGQLKCN